MKFNVVDFEDRFGIIITSGGNNVTPPPLCLYETIECIFKGTFLRLITRITKKTSFSYQTAKIAV